MAATISLCMIVRNEDKVLARCLESVRGCVDEIVIVDTGSSDATKEIAARYTDRIYDFEWIDDFSAARNYAFEQATGDYLLWLDADDVLLPTDAAALRRYKDEQLAGCDVVMLRYNTAFDELGRPTFFFYRERLIRRTLPHRWVGRVHEVVVHSGAVAYAEIAVTHKSVKAVYGDRNLRIYEKQIADGETLSPRELFYYGRELYYHGRYDDAQRVLLSFLGTGEGFLENCIDACLLLAHCRRAAGDDAGEARALCESFLYDVPRADVCCALGNVFLRRAEYRTAIHWFTQATLCPRGGQGGGFVNEDAFGYIPYLQLCVCYDRLGEREAAAHYNRLAGEIRPESPQVLQNRAYFASLGVS